MDTVLSLLDAAIDRRGELLRDPDTTCCRVFNAPGDGIGGIDIDRYADFATLIVYEGHPSAASLDLRAIARRTLRRLEPCGVRAVYLKPHPRDRSGVAAADPPPVLTDPTPLAGSTRGERAIVREHTIAFEVRPSDGFSTGLFLDQRENRHHLAGIVAANDRVTLLNLFAYTGGFSVAAAAAGATTTTVDVSANYLAWARRNFEINSIDHEAHHFARMDALEFLRHAKRKGWRYDAIVLDPPSFGARDKRRGVPAFSIERDLPTLVAEAAERLTPGGILFMSTNNRSLCERAGEPLDRIIARALGPSPTRLELPEQTIDFPGNGTRFQARLLVPDGSA